MIVPPKYIQEKGDAYFNTHPVGTGPFQFAGYQPKVGIQLKAYPGFWGDKAKLSELNYRFIPEPSTAVVELQAGRVDLVIPLTIPIAMIPTIQASAKLDVVTVKARRCMRCGLILNPA